MTGQQPKPRREWCPGCGQDTTAPSPGEWYGGQRWCLECLDMDVHTQPEFREVFELLGWDE